MTYEPHPTNMLPEIGAAFPITDELPAVRIGGGSGGQGGATGRFFLKLVGFLLVVAIAAVVAILVIDNQRSNQVATNDAQPTPTALAGQAGDDNSAPTANALDDADPGFWQVVGVADGLNVRSGPGTDTNIIGALDAAERHVFGTGERSTVNGAEWKQITFGDNDTVGWVSARFLATDIAPIDGAPTPTSTPAAVTSTSVVCFRSTNQPTIVARVQFTNGTTISGLLRTINGGNRIDESLSGTLSNGEASVTLTADASQQTKRQNWSFNPASVDLGNGRSLRVVDCADVATQLG